jgi:A/G-specific adenine glycosylase
MKRRSAPQRPLPRLRGRDREGAHTPCPITPSPTFQPKSDVSDFGQSIESPNSGKPEFGRKRGRERTELAAPAAADLLAWYDRHRRTLPWRAAPGERADPYRVWLSEIMLQQTTVKAVAPYFARFVARWPHVRALAAAPLEDVLRLWAGLGYYARARNLHACAKAVTERHGGLFPRSETELATLPGIGAYTAAAIAAIAFGARAAPVDGNIERVVARLFAVADELPAAKEKIRGLVESLVPAARAGDFAQALMDLGATICTPKKPACALCPWMHACAARRRGDPETFPVKAPKREGRLRRGAAFVVVRADGCVLVRSRPPKGLLGGMTEVPTTEWTHDFDQRHALVGVPRLSRARPKWHRIPGVVTHVFTHFPLELVVYAATVGAAAPVPAGMRWVALAELAGEALPNVMRKVVAHVFQSPAGTANLPAADLVNVKQPTGRAT